MSLVVFFILNGCTHRYTYTEDVEIIWNGSKAEKLTIIKELAGNPGKAQVEKQVLIYLSSNPSTPILGQYELTTDKIVFTPLIPFTHGKTYNVFVNGKLVEEIEIPTEIVVAVPSVAEVYPTRDTVPENLLKIYIEFSQPMKEGEALQHIALIKNDRDTLPDVFLDLQPELWNKDRTMLTLWFDPGRIKRDLQPNLKLGPPLTKGNKYTLLIKKEWEDQEGTQLMEGFRKNFITTQRDSILPDVLDWDITVPSAGTKHSLIIDFKQPMDYLVVKNAIHILDKNKKEVFGTYDVDHGEDHLAFIPDSAWVKGDYYLQVEGRLEDLAGNNLDRLFDNDNTQKLVKENTRMKLLKIE
jgi:hypothetical protein